MGIEIEVRKCRGRDIKQMKGRLREEDVIEIKRRTGKEAYPVLVDSYRRSEVAYVGLVGGEIACAWGVAHESILSAEGQIWLLSTSAMEKNPVGIARKTKIELKKLLERYPKLSNHVDAEYTLCVRWLKWLGFTVEKPITLGARGGRFSHFYIENKTCKRRKKCVL